MSKPLIIVESPTKAKTIEKFLGRRYSVVASMGHVRDLPKSQLGVDVDNGFQPKYITIRGKGDTLKDLRKARSKASRVFLATDPDREGEAISWHLAQALEIEPAQPLRVEFHEITKEAVGNALKHPRKIDLDLVDSQQARRVLDRLVGYNLSPLLWKKVRPGLSAGRVQSAALRIVVDREDEIESFIPKEYWTISALLRVGERQDAFTARFHGKNGDKIELTSSVLVDSILKELDGKPYKVVSVKRRERKRSAAPAFTTSTLQQEASRRLGFGVRRTMSVAQQLYEGIDLGPGGQVGLISYIRTDSTRVADQARDEALEYVTQKYGKEYAEPEARQEEKKPGQQGAHEAIRPTTVLREPEGVKPFLTPEQFKLYKLIWERFVSSNMSPAVYDTVSVDISAGDYLFRAAGSTMRFNGFMAIYVEGDDDNKEEAEQALPEIDQDEDLALDKLEPKQHFTQPPSRFTEAMLVKALEERGIGRPSTYAPIVETLLARRYIVREERRLQPTDLGKLVTSILKDYFPDVVNVTFTANMEEQLDRVEQGDVPWQDVIGEFYSGFAPTLRAAEERIGGFEIKDEPTDIPCDKCGRMMVKKHGRYGEFLACPGFPECRNTKAIIEELDVNCPDCGGKLVVRKTKKGRTFYGCSNYPQCTFTTWNKPTGRSCPECGAFLVEKKSKGKSSYVCSKDCGFREEAEENDTRGEEMN